MNRMTQAMLTLALMTAPFAVLGFEGDIISTGNLSYENALVELEPMAGDEGKLMFTVYVNTHSVSFEFFDFQASTTLFVNGKEFKPESVPDLYGHHNEGLMVFDFNEDIETDVKVVIRDMANEPIREYTWPVPTEQ